MLLSILLACGLAADHLGSAAEPGSSAEKVFEVPKGSTARGLGPGLEREGLVASGDNFSLYVRATKEGGCIKAGRFRLSPGMTAGQILEALCGVPLANDVPFTVLEGWRIREIDAALAEAGFIKAGEYRALALSPEMFKAPFPLPPESLEGYLYPETYMLTPDRFNAKGFIQRQIDTFGSVFFDKSKEKVAASKRSLYEVVVMASMLEREEPMPAQRPLVAGILWKRLDSGWKLGVDATSRYALAQWNDRKAFLKLLRDPKEPYNTRLRQGLPPTPIGNPSVQSLDAALSPKESEFWYYLHDASKTLRPSRNGQEHEALRKKYNVY
jgi:UPF0755 protein